MNDYNSKLDEDLFPLIRNFKKPNILEQTPSKMKIAIKIKNIPAM